MIPVKQNTEKNEPRKATEMQDEKVLEDPEFFNPQQYPEAVLCKLPSKNVCRHHWKWKKSKINSHDLKTIWNEHIDIKVGDASTRQWMMAIAFEFHNDELSHRYTDNAAMHLICVLEQFNTIMSNMCGDILSKGPPCFLEVLNCSHQL